MIGGAFAQEKRKKQRKVAARRRNDGSPRRRRIASDPPRYQRKPYHLWIKAVDEDCSHQKLERVGGSARGCWCKEEKRRKEVEGRERRRGEARHRRTPLATPQPFVVDLNPNTAEPRTPADKPSSPEKAMRSPLSRAVENLKSDILPATIRLSHIVSGRTLRQKDLPHNR